MYVMQNIWVDEASLQLWLFFESVCDSDVRNFMLTQVRF